MLFQKIILSIELQKLKKRFYKKNIIMLEQFMPASFLTKEMARIIKGKVSEWT